MIMAVNRRGVVAGCAFSVIVSQASSYGSLTLLLTWGAPTSYALLIASAVLSCTCLSAPSSDSHPSITHTLSNSHHPLYYSALHVYPWIVVPILEVACCRHYWNTNPSLIYSIISLLSISTPILFTPACAADIGLNLSLFLTDTGSVWDCHWLLPISSASIPRSCPSWPN